MTDKPTRAVIHAAKSTEDKRGSTLTQIEDYRALAERELHDIEITLAPADPGPEYCGPRPRGVRTEGPVGPVRDAVAITLSIVAGR